MTTVITALGLVVVPILAGLLIGFTLSQLSGRRWGGVLAATLMLTLPWAGTVLLSSWRPIIGLWDAIVEGFLVGLGVLFAGHRWFPGWREGALAMASVAASLVVCECCVRYLVPVGPRFPGPMEPNLLLVNALEVNRIVQAFDIGSNEIVCSALYGDTYERKLNRLNDSTLALPYRYSPRADKTRRVLHVGDSMVYGLGVQAAERFTNVMEQLEPDTEHINAGLPGTAPDSYYGVIHGWADHPLDLVVMYLFEGNDYAGLDGPSPCCNFEPVLRYAGQRALLRCPSPTALDLDNVGLRVLRLISPPPYLLRALIPESHAASLLAAALVQRKIDGTVTESMKAEVDAIVATAAEELRSHGTSLVVVMLPDRAWIEHGGSSERPDRMVESARKAHVPVLDARALFQAAGSRGESDFLGSGDCHFNPAGHLLLARWLTDALPRR